MTGIFNGWRDILKIVTTDIESAYAESIETEFGIHASRTVSHVFAWEVFYRETGIFHQNFAEALMYYPVALEMFDRTNCDKVVLGSGGKREAAIACAAEQRNVDVYYVAHGIEHAGTHTKATSLVSGELAVEQHKIHTYGVTDSNLTVTGRPYLTNLYDQFENVWTENGEKPEEPLKLIVLTTGHRDKIRTRFVKAVLSSARNSSIDFDITIKIHPNETKAFYQNLLSTLSIVGVNNIRIETDDLFGHLYRADIAATTVSNAGLEAIITGTPCISVQLSNLGQPQFYTELTSIPKLKNENEVEAFFRSLTIEDIWKIRNEQMDDVQDAFVLSDDAAENMAQVIDNE